MLAALFFDAQSLFRCCPPGLHRFVGPLTGGFPFASITLSHDPQFHFCSGTVRFLFATEQVFGQLRHARFGSLDFLLGLEPHLAFNFFARLLLRNKPRASVGFFFRLRLGRFPSQSCLAFLLP